VAFLDFISNRQESQRQSGRDIQQQKPETAKEMYAREAAGEKGKYTPAERMPESEQVKVKEISSRMQNLGQGVQRDHVSQTPAPGAAENSSSPQAMRQKMANQDKASPALSPTSEQSGKTAAENNSPSHENSGKAQRPNTSQSQQRTLPRRAPSWER
jgi:hypothetical protein